MSYAGAGVVETPGVAKTSNKSPYKALRKSPENRDSTVSTTPVRRELWPVLHGFRRGLGSIVDLNITSSACATFATSRPVWAWPDDPPYTSAARAARPRRGPGAALWGKRRGVKGAGPP